MSRGFEGLRAGLLG